MQWSPLEVDQLMNSSSAAALLDKCCQLRPSSLSYSRLGQLCGFKSRSYFRDIIKSQKPMSAELALKVSSVLKFNFELRDKFFELCAREYQSCKELVNTVTIHKSVKTKSIADKISRYESGYENPNIPVVFAAIGDETTKTTIMRIEKLTGLGEKTIQEALEKLIEVGLVQKSGRFYILASDHVVTTKLTTNAAFKKYYLSSLEKTYKTARLKFNSESDLFFSSHFLINEQDLPEIKKLLRETLIEFINQRATFDKGDKVVSLIAGLTS